MATLDPRLLELIEALRGTRLDWLAFELIDGIRQGWVSTEPPETLMKARVSARSREKPRARRETTLGAQPADPIEGSDQIKWAAEYVAQRLDDTLAMLHRSTENLEMIVNASDSSVDLNPENNQEVAIEFIEPEGGRRRVGRNEANAARAALPKLRAALEAWSSNVVDGK